MPLLALSACGGGGGPPAASTPTPPPFPAAAPPPPPPPPPVTIDYRTAEYTRSNAAVQAQAITAYQSGATGAGITVGVIDTGIDIGSAEFAGRISPVSADLAGSRGLQDESGHGSAVSDVLLGAKNDVGISGMAFNATLLVLHTDTPGTCATATVGSTEN
ncbi:MAG: peptidase, partial [Sphingomonadales bacterium]|nr:peptidase [Sphingomonadales bacterium]